MAGSNFKKLDAWRHARRLVSPVYAFTRRFPDDERFTLTLQMRKAVHSVHLNIAEGYGRLSNGEWQQFLGQSRGSLMELESAIVCAFDLEYCTEAEAKELSVSVQRTIRLVNGLLKKSACGFSRKKYKPLTANR